ncbi:hypothetical protein K5D44_04330 [Pseudomonas cichorii]|nr:hypothetical protein [Pseudomonas cichorii]MBX8538936.1 hypothetical protein [Pseudomonas cichorii]MBX8563903.1 hypothetical protein [Pseudomonas cichorii]MBX8578772.1 hypothetical protein [Pseudomonas cichorii]MBX8596476.1 hypothetical protein [Pseudomonas cichorii]MBX8600790.1 hypothetical protein [Pseudomonas cichorii]
MSVLNFPRIYFNGHMFWNPPTANNNDMFPLYDAVKMQMNWPFLKEYGITPENAATTLMPWTIAPIPRVPDYVLQVPGNYGASGIPGEWDLFGDNGCGTVGYKDIQSLVIGGELQNDSYISQDDLVNKSYQLVGNPFGSTAQTPARFVDVSPWQNTFTALYFDKLIIGDSQCGLTLDRQYRMLDRFLNFNWGAFGGLNYVTTTWQTCFPKENLQWVNGNSVLLKNLQQQMEKQNAKGLMFRFSTYLTYYDKNGIFNDYPPFITHSADKSQSAQEKIQKEMQAMYQKGLDNVADIFFNPAYSRTAGTLGLWFEDEFPTAPAGRRLVPASPISVYKKTPGDTPLPPGATIQLGVISAQVQPESNILSLDLGTGFPFYTVDDKAAVPVAEKFQAGDYEVGVRTNGQFSKVASFGFDQYQQSAFDKRSGILDFSLTPDAISKLQSGPLELQLSGSSPTTAATQQMWTAEVVESASFIDVGDTKTLNIMVQYDGKPAANTVVWVAEYNNAFSVTTSSYYLAFSNAADFTLFENYPPTYEQNASVLPQFLNTPPVLSLAADGSGRQLTEFLPPLAASVLKDDSPKEVSYQTYLSNPTALELTPCLSLANAIGHQDTLEGKNGSTVNYSVAKITTDANGVAQLTFTAQAPGFPTLRFFVQEGDQAPQIPFSFNYLSAYTDFLAPLRVLPLEPELQQDFITYWNSIYEQQDARVLIWEKFIYPRILEPFYYLYPIMAKYMPLNSLKRIEGAVDQLIVLISKPYQEESTLAMPITRDMPQSRRAVLELWAQSLVKGNYPPTPLSMSDFPKSC